VPIWPLPDRSSPLRTLALASAFIFLVSEFGGQTGAKDLSVFRDAYGIPHIFARTDEGAMFGLGYVSAEDRLLQMEYSRRVVQGRLAEMLGDVGPRGNSALDSDLKFRRMGIYAHARELAGRLDGRTQSLLRAYSAGVNFYLVLNRTRLPSALGLRGLTPEPWAPEDCLAVWERIAAFFGPGWADKAKPLHEFEDLLAKGLTEKEAAAQLTATRVLDESAAVVLESDFDPALRVELEAYAAAHGYKIPSRTFDLLFPGPVPFPSFSHAWVVGGKRTTTGAAVLVSDPQTTVRNPSVWYESHVSGAAFNSRGIGVAGCPGFLIGWNENVAWGMTALGADNADLFRLKMKPGNASVYLYDGREETFGTRTEVVGVRDGAPQNVAVRWSRLGPVVTELVSDRRAGEEYALKTPFLADGDGHTVEALLAMMTAADASDFGDALAAWASPGVHVLFGDSRGNIGYWTKAAIPLRSPLSPLGSQAAQSGQGKAYDWQDIIPHRFLPHVFNPASGTIVSGNNLPVGAWYPLPLGVGTGGAGDTQRSWRLRTVIGSPDKTFTPEDVRAVHFDDVNQAILTIFEVGRLLLAKGTPLSRESVELLNLLEGWTRGGGHCRTAEPYFAGAYHVQRQFRLAQAGPLHAVYGGGENGLCAFLKAVWAKLNSNPAVQAGADEIAYIDESLKTGWRTAVAQYGPDPSKWQTAFNQSVGRLAVPYGVNLEGFPSLDPALDFVSAVLSDPEGGTIWSQKGNSYTQWVDLADPDRSLALLPPGISENPASAFYRVEQTLWERGELRLAPLSRSAVEKSGARPVRLVDR
jgi:penicillin amidase